MYPSLLATISSLLLGLAFCQCSPAFVSRSFTRLIKDHGRVNTAFVFSSGCFAFLPLSSFSSFSSFWACCFRRRINQTFLVLCAQWYCRLQGEDGTVTCVSTVCAHEVPAESPLQRQSLFIFFFSASQEITLHWFLPTVAKPATAHRFRISTFVTQQTLSAGRDPPEIYSTAVFHDHSTRQ